MVREAPTVQIAELVELTGEQNARINGTDRLAERHSRGADHPIAEQCASIARDEHTLFTEEMEIRDAGGGMLFEDLPGLGPFGPIARIA